MKKLAVILLALLLAAGCAAQKPVEEEQTTPAPEAVEEKVDTTSQPTKTMTEYDGENIEAVTSASIVQPDSIQHYLPKGYTDSESKKAMFVIADPRYDSVTYDLANTAMKHLEDNGIEVVARDLYTMRFNPVLMPQDFYNAKDGFGETPEDVKTEQDYVTQSDYIIFVYPNWHDAETAMVKGYKERVFAKQFAYEDTEDGLKGKLDGKGVYTIMNCGWLGGGRGYIGDGIIDTETWDKYMNAYKVFDDDTCGFWGTENLGRFMNDRTPSNTSENYASEIEELRTALKSHLDKVFLGK